MWLLGAVVVAAGLLLLARFAMPSLGVETPQPHLTTPPSGAVDVPPRSQIVLHFSTAMNPASVEQALLLDPPIPARLTWDQQRTTLTISPTTALQPDTQYTVSLNTGALSRYFRPLAAATSESFRTAPAPVVLTAFPVDTAHDVPTTSPISISFSRAIVPAAAIGQESQLPALHFDPPLDGTVTWLNQTTLLFRPSELAPGTRYQAMVDADLADVAGIPLGRPYSWSFSTPPATAGLVSPASTARTLSGKAPLVLQFSQPFDVGDLRAGLTISPTIAGVVSAATLPNATQVLTYTPATDWRAATNYQIELAPSLTPLGANLPLSGQRAWQLRTASQPRVIGRFPGEGQVLPGGQSIRLIFSTPIDAGAIKAAATLTPTAPNLQVTASGAEARISADFQPATEYVLSIPQTITATNGAALGQGYRFRFNTAPAAAALTAPEVRDHIARGTPNAADILLRRTNISLLDLALYRLDAPTTVRAIAFDENEWRNFSPERYGQPLLRSWSVPLSDTLNLAAESRVPLLAADDKPLPSGIYYARILSAEGPRADLLLFISDAQLLLQQASNHVQLWAVDATNATPIAKLPLSLYQDGALLASGTTDDNGLWRVPLAIDPLRPSLALASGDLPAIVSSSWGNGTATRLGLSEQYRAFLTTDRAVYRPGERVALAGFVRKITSGANGVPQTQFPPVGLPAALTVRPPGSAEPIYQAPLQFSYSGVVSTTFALPADAQPGEYRIGTSIGSALFDVTLRVAAEPTEPLNLAIEPPQQQTPDLPITITASAPDGLPLASVAISWTLTTEPAPLLRVPGYVIGDDEWAAPLAAVRQGSGQTDTNGRLSFVITDTLPLPLHYRLRATAIEPGGPTATAQTTFVHDATPAYVGIRAPTRILEPGQSTPIDLRAVTAEGQPLPDTPIQVVLSSRVWVRTIQPPGQSDILLPIDTPVLTRTIRSDASGNATLPIRVPRAGEYRLSAQTHEPTEGIAAALSLWSNSPGFTDWRQEPNAQLQLLPERERYQPGETATILPLSPFADARALVTIRRGDTFSSTVQLLRAGEPLTITLAPAEANDVQVGAVLLQQPPANDSRSLTGALVTGVTTLPLVSDTRSLTLTLSADKASYAPGETATITLTTTNGQGHAVPADIILGVVGAAGATHADPAQAFALTAPPPLLTAYLAPAAADQFSVAQPAPPPPNIKPSPAPALLAYWNPAVHVNATGRQRLRVPLPHSAGPLRIVAWAASGTDRFAAQELAIETVAPLALELNTPTGVRAGDHFDVSARVRNTSSETMTVSLSLTAEQLTLASDIPQTQQRALAPGEQISTSWRMQTSDPGRARVEVVARTPTDERVSASRELLIGAMAGELQAGSALLDGTANTTITSSAGEAATLEIVLSPNADALARECLAQLEQHIYPSALDDAARLLISAALGDGGEVAPVALARLLAAQHGDGGWGWWPSSPSDPQITAAVLEALAAARRLGLTIPASAVEHAAAMLAPEADELSATERARALYALSLHGRADQDALRALSETPEALDAAALAYLALADDTDRARSETLVAQLAALAQHRAAGQSNEQVYWEAAGDSVATTALATMALARSDPEQTLLPAARRWLAASIQQMPAFERAHALVALGAGARTSANEPPLRYSIALNGTALAPRETVATSVTQHLLTRLNPGANILSTSTTSGTAFLTYRWRGASTTPAGTVNVVREYLDPLNGRTLDPTALTSDRLILVRLTVITQQPQRLVRIDEPLPGGMALVASGSGDFESVQSNDQGLMLARTTLAPGIYEHRYLMRALAPGQYAAPGATVRLLDDRAIGSAPSEIITIVPRS